MNITQVATATHEEVYRVEDAKCGLLGFIAIHSTVLGPAAGGLRMRPYANEEAALTDALRLSEGMTYKNAAAGLRLGGGKAVIIGDPAKLKTPALLHAFGRAVEACEGRYWTAEDMGMSPADMAELAKKTRFVAGLSDGACASGEGLGNVGWNLCELLTEAGAKLIVTDIDAGRVSAATETFDAQAVGLDDIYAVQADIFAPCAIGGILNEDTIPQLGVKAVAGGANNQLAKPSDADLLAERGILYAPDFVANGGGIINVATEVLQIEGRVDWVAKKLVALDDTMEAILSEAAKQGVSPAAVAQDVVAKAIKARAA